MPKTDKPKRKPMPIRFSPAEREAIARIQLYLQKNTQAAAVRAAVAIAINAVARLSAPLPRDADDDAGK